LYTSIYYNKDRKKAIIFDDEKGKIEYDYKPYSWKLTDKESEWKTIYGNPVVKTFKYSGTNFEIDVSPIQRILVDNYYESDEPAKNNIAFFDIEVSSVGGYAKVEDADKEIYSAVVYFNGKYYVFISTKQVITFTKENVVMLNYKSEEKMLKEFCRFLNEKNITILSSWNGDRYDIPYLVNRMYNIGVDFCELSPIKVVETGFNGFKQIGCRNHLDYMLLYKKFCLNDRESFKLDAIGELELGLKKVEHSGIDDLYENDINKFIEYNLRDVEILVELEKKLDYINLTISLCHESHIPYEWIYQQSRLIEGAFFTYFKRNKIVAINRHEKKEEEKIEGAYVKDPIKGRYKKIIDLDFTSLYPNVVRTLNLSNETKIGRVSNWKKYIQDFYYEKNLDRMIEFTYIDRLTRKIEILNITLERFINKVKKEKWSVSALGVVCRTDEVGFLSKIITDWFDKRVEFQKLKKESKNDDDKKKYHIKQYAKKIEMNSLYGAIAMSSFRFYDRDLAESVTVSSQYLIKFSEKVVNKYFKKEVVVAGDTDSLFIVLDDIADTVEEIREQTNFIQKYANDKLKYICLKLFNVSDNKYLSLKQELIGSIGFWAGKKMYAIRLIEKEGKPCNEIETKGMASVKSSFPKSMKILLKEIIVDILDERDKDYIDKKIFQFNKDKNKVDILDLGVNTGVKELEKYYDAKIRYKKGSPMHCKSALNYNYFLEKNNLEFKYRMIQNGDKIKCFYLKSNPYYFSEMALNNEDISEEVKAFIEKHIDRDKIVKSVLHEKIKVFYEDVLGWNFPDFTQNLNTEYF